MLVVNELCGQEWPGALLADWVAVAVRRLFFFSSRLSEPAGLQKGVGHHRHQGMAVKSGPGSSLEVIQPQLLFELLMGLFAYPACFDRASQDLDRRVGW